MMKSLRKRADTNVPIFMGKDWMNTEKRGGRRKRSDVTYCINSTRIFLLVMEAYVQDIICFTLAAAANLS